MAKYLYINSADKKNSYDTSTNFQVDFDSELNLPKLIKIHSATIPLSIYNVPVSRNTFHFRITNEVQG